MSDDELIIELARECYEVKKELRLYQAWAIQLDKELEAMKEGKKVE